MKKLDFDVKLKLNGKRLNPTKSVKYLGIKIVESLTRNENINIAIKKNERRIIEWRIKTTVAYFI